MRAARLEAAIGAWPLRKKYGKGASVELPPILGRSHVHCLVKRDWSGRRRSRRSGRRWGASKGRYLQEDTIETTIIGRKLGKQGGHRFQA